jgi:hypothetical protein
MARKEPYPPVKGVPVHEHKAEVDKLEVSPVVWPAYPATVVGADDDHRHRARQREAWLQRMEAQR